MQSTSHKRRNLVLTALAVAMLAGGAVVACGGSDAPADKPAAKADKSADRDKKGKKAAKPEPKAPTEPVPTLLIVQAQFGKVDGKSTPLPAKLLLMRHADGEWFRETIEDPESNVFHKAIAWRDGILTIGAERAPKPAQLKHWTRDGDGWKAETIWEKAWDGAKFNRLRDLEIGDVDGDGADELVIATHDQGVVAVGDETDGTWTFAEFDRTPDTFVHEIEIGDVDGDGTAEFYSTPSERNRASGESQPGSVFRYVPDGNGGYTSSSVVDYTESHAKEILVTDVDGDGTDELYVVREAHTEKKDGKTERVDPVGIVRFTADGQGGFDEKVVATLDDDQCRFLLPGDLDHDGQTELVAAGFKSGLWLLEPTEDGFDTVLIDANSGGFEHASHAADLDGDGKLELYVAADQQKEFRQYVWNGTSFDRNVIGKIGPNKNSHITWNIQDGSF